LCLDQRWSTWAADPYRGEDYAVSVHRHDDIDPTERREI